MKPLDLHIFQFACTNHPAASEKLMYQFCSLPAADGRHQMRSKDTSRTRPQGNHLPCISQALIY